MLLYFIVYFIVIATLFTLLCFWLLRPKKDFVHCLMYHHINPEKHKDGVFVKDFAQQMQHLQQYQTFTFSELKKLNYSVPPQTILVTFDDGYRSNYELAFPILKKLKIKATIFLNTKYIEHDDNYLTWQQITEMYQSGLIDFQLHTHSHSLIPKTTEVTGFYNHNTSHYLKRESFNLFFAGLYNPQQNAEQFNGLPTFKFRSRIAVRGYMPKADFVQKFNRIRQQTDFQEKSIDQQKQFLTQLFHQHQTEFFHKISQQEYLANIDAEIKQNKQLIKQYLGYEATVLAYPWGQRYSGPIKDIKQLGVDTFVTTKKGCNSLQLNTNCIYRIDCETFEKIEDFVATIQQGNGYLYYKLQKYWRKK